MLCERCLDSEALFHFTWISHNTQKELHLCLNCAKEMKIDSPDSPDNILLSYEGFMEGEYAMTCLSCGLTTKELIYDGRPGCPVCYKYFNAVFSTISENTSLKKYTGKKPENYKDIFDFQELNSVEEKNNSEFLSSKSRIEKQLKKALADERYEDAAKFRDALKEVTESE